MNRGFELAASLYIFGEYNSGWSLMQEVFKKSQDLNGKFSMADIPIQIYWAKWAIQIDELDKPMSWIREWKEHQYARSDLSSAINEVKISLIEAELLLALGELAQADDVLSSVWASENQVKLSSDDRLALEVLKLEKLLLERDSKAILSSLTEPSGLSPSGDGPRAEWGPYVYWYRGLALTLDGLYETAETELRVAESEAANVFGPLHPRTSTTSFNRLVISLVNVPRDDGDFKRKLSTLRRITKRLKASLGERHPHVERAEQIMGNLERGALESMLGDKQKIILSMILY